MTEQPGKLGGWFLWRSLRSAYLLLTAPDERLSLETPANEKPWLGVTFLCLATGLLSNVVWGAAWKLFGDYGILLMPPAMTLAVLALWPLRRTLLSWASLAGPDALARGLLLCVTLLVLALAMIRLRSTPVYVENPLPAWAAWLRPQYEQSRVLLLMPLWGGWGMLIAGRFCRLTDRTEPAVAQLARTCGPMTAALCMGVLLAVTIVYFSYLPWTQLTISGSAILAAVFGSMLICWRRGGLRRDTLLAVNLLTQLAFLLACLANC